MPLTAPADRAGLPEPVRRFFAHALGDGHPVASAWRVVMRGSVRAAGWLPFRAVEDITPSTFTWHARVGPFGLPLLGVVDAYDGAAGSMQFRLGDALRLRRATGPDITRSAAGRLALEAVAMAPAAALPEHGVTWSAAGGDELVGRFERLPGGPEVHVRIDADGRLLAAWAQRWGPLPDGGYGLQPCGCDAGAEATFSGMTIPREIEVSWGYGTPTARPFFRAVVDAAAPDAG